MEQKRWMLRATIAGLVILVVMEVMAMSAWSADVRVVTSKKTPADGIDAGTVKDIFLGKKSAWSDGSTIEFVTLESGNTHVAFLKTYVRKTPSQFSTYWKKQVLTGKGATPKSFASESDLVAYVAGKNGAVGYVSGNADVSSANVIIEK